MNAHIQTIMLALWLAVLGITTHAQTPENDAELAKLKELAAREIEEPAAGRWYGTPQWKALIRLAQLGDKVAAERVINVARRQTRGFAESLVVLEHVASIRQTEAVEFLKEHLDSDERLPDLDGGVPGTLICQRAAALLASILDDFPVKKEYYSDYTTEDIDRCRKWMNSHKGQWRITESPVANNLK